MIDRYAKAILGALIAGLGALQTALLPDEMNQVTVTQAEWIVIAMAFLGALGLVWGIPNSEPKVVSPGAPGIAQATHGSEGSTEDSMDVPLDKYGHVRPHRP